MAEWTVRLRGANIGGNTVLQLPKAGDTTLGELRDLVAKSAQQEAAGLVIKAGFPPRALSGDAGPDAIISALGVANAETLILDWPAGASARADEHRPAGSTAGAKRKATEKEKVGGGAAATTTTKSGRKTTCTSEKMAATDKELREREAFALGKGSAKGSSPAKGNRAAAAEAAAKTKRFKQAGHGHSLRGEEGDASSAGASEAGGAAAAAPAAASAAGGSAAASSAGAAGADAGRSATSRGGRGRAGGGGLMSGQQATGIMSLGSEASGVQEGESDMSADLLASFEPGRSRNPMRVALKEARQKQGAVEMATAREAAVMAGKVEFVEKQVGIQGNRMVTILEVRWEHGSHTMSEAIANFPRPVVVQILAELLREDQPKEYRCGTCCLCARSQRTRAATHTHPHTHTHTHTHTHRVNIKPHNMACVSPRVFWNIVRHCQVSGHRL